MATAISATARQSRHDSNLRSAASDIFRNTTSASGNDQMTLDCEAYASYAATKLISTCVIMQVVPKYYLGNAVQVRRLPSCSGPRSTHSRGRTCHAVHCEDVAVVQWVAGVLEHRVIVQERAPVLQDREAMVEPGECLCMKTSRGSVLRRHVHWPVSRLTCVSGLEGIRLLPYHTLHLARVAHVAYFRCCSSMVAARVRQAPGRVLAA